MKLTDTHTHLYMKEFDKDVDSVIKKAYSKKINRFLIPSTHILDIPKILKLEKKYPNICYSMIGIHPNRITLHNIEKELNTIEKFLSKHSFISVGEIGIDLYLEKKFLSQQKYVFQTQIQLAKKKNYL